MQHEGPHVECLLAHYKQGLIKDVQADPSTKALFPTPVPSGLNVHRAIKTQ